MKGGAMARWLLGLVLLAPGAMAGSSLMAGDVGQTRVAENNAREETGKYFIEICCNEKIPFC
jgi:hypothetical protein